MATLSAPSASVIVTTTASTPRKALTSLQSNGVEASIDVPTSSSSKGSNNDSALLELRSLALAASSASLDASAVDAVLERFTSLADRFQELPHLLDPHLPFIIGTCLGPALLRAARAGDSPLAGALARLLWSAVSARGKKAALRFFPAEVGDFEPVVRVLAGAAGLEVPPVAATAVEEEDDDEEEHEEEEEDEREASPPPSPSDQAETLARVGSELSSKNAWQARCCLLLWLAHASAVPFPMALLDASFEEAAGGGAEAGDGGGESDGGSAEEGGREGGTAAAAAATSSPSWPPLAAAAQAAAAASLRSPGADRDSAVLALGRLLSRPDASGKPLKSFVLWACSQVAHASSSNPHLSSSSSSLAALGCVEALAQLFARAERAALAEVGPVAWQAAAALLLPPSLSSPEQRKSDSSSSSSHAMPGVHARRAAAKLASRIAMAVMPPPLARVSQQPFPSSSSSEVSSFPQQQQQSPAPPLSPAAAATAEAVVNALLVALRDRDTAVRWAAAKGISRLAARLPAKRDASELLRRCAGPLITGSDAADDAAWHGSALALASLARVAASAACGGGGGSGGGNTSSSCSPLLSTRRDARVAARGAAAALSYEFRRGERSVGSHVRDAGAYVTWALARCAAVVGGKGGDGGGGGEGETDDDDENDLPLTTSSLARALRPLGPLLLSVSCFDREVNCRRAAAAAFQEGAGRLPPEARKKRKGTKEGAGARTSDGAGDAANEEEEEAEAEAETGGAFARSLDAVRVGAADFFTLGSRSRATLSAGPAAARLHPSYAAAAVQALVGKVGRGTAGSKTTTTSSSNGSGKLWHWERATRELSARALARVLRSAVESGWCEEEKEKEEEGKAEGNGKKNPLCPSPSSIAALLLEKCGVASAASPSSCEPEEKHGALCALTELLGEFKEEEWKKKDSGNDGGGNDGGEGETSISSPSSSATVSFLPLDDATLAATATLPLSFSKLVRGRGGEMVREAAMRLVAAGARRRRASTAAPSAPLLPPDAAAAALAAVDECLRHPSQAVRSSAAEALSCLATAASSSSSFSSDSILLGLISEALPRWVRWLANDGISSGGGAARAGGAAALGALFGSGRSEADKNDNGSPLLHVLLLPAAPDALRALQRACRLEPDPANRDAEARAAAARALPVVAARVATAAADSSSSSSSPFSSSSSSPFSSWCLPDSIRALLDASSDYSTDRRGDVGSWVRGPATRGATELSLLLLLLSLSRAGGEEREEAKRLTPLVAGALARQASERCGRLRGEARSSLRSLLKAREFLPDAAALAEAVRAADEVHSSSVAAAAPLPNGGAEGDEGEGDGGENEEEEHHHHHHHHSHHHGGSGDDATLALATVLLRIPSYAPEAAAGLAACAGGLDAPLARAAGRALCSAAAAAGSAVAAGTATASSSSDVARALVSAWSSALARGEEARLGTPFLKAADALLSGIGEGGGGGKDEGEALCAPSSESSASDVSAPPSSDSPSPPPPSVSQAMLDLTLRACRRCRDPARLCAASALLCHLAGLDGRRGGGGGGREKASKAAATAVVDNRTTAARALRAAASLTGHSYPTVRRAAAENLSLRLLMGAPVVYDDEEEGEESERAREAVWRESGKAFEKEEGEEESESRQRRKPDAAAASDLLSETAWDGPTSAARAARARLLELLCLPPPGGDAAAEEAAAERAAEAQRRRRCEMGGGGVSAATAATGTASGYQSLVDAVSRGGAD